MASTVPNRANNVKRLGNVVKQTIKNAKEHEKVVPQVDHRENPDLAKKARQTFF